MTLLQHQRNAAAKFGVVGLSQTWRSGGADHGIRVSVLCSGWIDTALLDGAWPDDVPKPASIEHSPTIQETLVATGATIYPAAGDSSAVV